jgi:hypothetical protein
MRKGLIDQNPSDQHSRTGKIGKYFKYAMGEIILVVIGILIALQINNWNITQLNQEKEKSYLTEIKKNLESDLPKIEEVLAFNQTKKEKILECIQLFGKPNPKNNGPQIIGQRLQTMGSYENFEPNDLGFQNLMSASNIDLIQNNTVRQLLLEFYKFNFKTGTQKRAEEVTRQFVDYIVPKITTKEYYQRVYQVELDLPTNFDSEIHKDPKVLAHLELMNVVMMSQNELLNSKKVKIEELIEAVQRELEK